MQRPAAPVVGVLVQAQCLRCRQTSTRAAAPRLSFPASQDRAACNGTDMASREPGGQALTRVTAYCSSDLVSSPLSGQRATRG